MVILMYGKKGKKAGFFTQKKEGWLRSFFSHTLDIFFHFHLSRVHLFPSHLRCFWCLSLSSKSFDAIRDYQIVMHHRNSEKKEKKIVQSSWWKQSWIPFIVFIIVLFLLIIYKTYRDLKKLHNFYLLIKSFFI